MSLSTQAVGYLDITNAILRVGTLDVAGIQGVDAVTNVLKGNSVLLWDDQGSDMASPPFQLGAGAARSTSPPEIDLRNASGSNFMYAGLKLPNAWLCKFDMYIADTSTGNVHVQAYTESTTTYGDDGYQLIFDGANNTVTLEYDGAQVVQENVTLTTGDWETVVVSFNRGAWSVTYGDDVVLQIDDSERADVYDNPVTGQYFRVETDASTARKIRYFKITNNGPFLQSNTNDISYVSGNVAIGQHSTTYKLSVAGTANVGALDVQSNLEVGTANLFVDTLTGRVGVGTDLPAHALDVTGNVQVGTANLFVDTLTGRVGVGTTEPEYDLDVHGSANVGALSVTSVTSNLEVGTANLFVDTLTGKVGVGSTVPEKELVVTGTVRVQDALSNVADVSVVQDDLTVSSNVAISGGGLELTQVSNVAQIKSSSNVVTEFVRSKKLIKYPRVNMTANSSGGYTASASSENGTRYAYKAFNGDYNLDNVREANWETAGSKYSTTSPYDALSGAASITDEQGNIVRGEWIKLVLPEQIKLMELEVASPTRRPDVIAIYGQSGGTNYFIDELGRDRLIDLAFVNFVHVHLTVDKDDDTGYYDTFIFVIKSSSNNDGLIDITHLGLLGVSINQSDAHGTDSIVRSVPVIPNTEDWLEVYYEGENYSGSGNITDESGNGFTGTVNGSLTYDNTWKAWKFDGSSSYISTTLSNPSGDWTHSVSLWWRQDEEPTSPWDYIVHVGNASVKNSSVLALNTGYELAFTNYSSSSLRTNFRPELGKWYHVTYVYRGGAHNRGAQLYINGVISGGDYDGSTTMSLPANAVMELGRNRNVQDYAHGSMANFRLFNRPLSPEEIWHLYAYQKEFFQNSPNAITLTGGRLGIGTSLPKASLHVHGDVMGASPVYWHVARTNGHVGATTKIVYDTVRANKGGGYDSTSGWFMAPVSGWYFTYFGGANRSASSVLHMSLRSDNGVTLLMAYDKPYGTSLMSAHRAGLVYISKGEAVSVYVTSSTVDGNNNIGSASAEWSGFLVSAEYRYYNDG